MGEFSRINYIMNKNYLFMCYGKTMEIFNFEKNMQNIYIENNDIYEYEDILWGPQKIMKEEERVGKALANYSDTLFFGRDNKENLNIYIFDNNTLNIYYNFKIEDIIEVIKMKNNDFIIYAIL